MRRRLLSSAIAGFASGLLTLGVGGRLLMRLLAFTTPEGPRFTWSGTLEIIALGAGCGLLTGPLILAARSRLNKARLTGAAFGLSVFAVAAVLFILFSGFRGPIVAPREFLWLGAISFPALFLLYGIAVSSLYCRRSRAA